MVGLLASSTGNLSDFTTLGTELLTWLLTTMGNILNFLMSHPIALVSIIFGLIIAAVGMIFNILKGR